MKVKQLMNKNVSNNKMLSAIGKPYSLVCVAMLTASLVGCGGDDNGTSEAGPRELLTVKVTPVQSQLVRGVLGDQVPAGLTQQYVAEGCYSDKVCEDLTEVAEWRSANPAVAEVVAPGKVKGLLPNGSTAVLAAVGAVSGQSSLLTVSDAVVLEVALQRRDSAGNVLTGELPLGAPFKLALMGELSDGAAKNLIDEALIANSAPEVVSQIDKTTISGKSVGQASLVATYEDMSSTLDLIVGEAVPERINLSAGQTMIPLGLSQSLNTEVFFSDGTVAEPDEAFEWTSSDPSVFKVDDKGVVTALAKGEAMISVRVPSTGANGTIDMSVTEASYQALALELADGGQASVPVGLSVPLLVRVTLSDDTTQLVSAKDVSWKSSDDSNFRVKEGVVTVGSDATDKEANIHAEWKLGDKTLTSPPILIKGVDAVITNIRINDNRSISGIYHVNADVELWLQPELTWSGQSAWVAMPWSAVKFTTPNKVTLDEEKSSFKIPRDTTGEISISLGSKTAKVAIDTTNNNSIRFTPVNTIKVADSNASVGYDSWWSGGKRCDPSNSGVTYSKMGCYGNSYVVPSLNDQLPLPNNGGIWTMYSPWSSSFFVDPCKQFGEHMVKMSDAQALDLAKSQKLAYQKRGTALGRGLVVVGSSSGLGGTTTTIDFVNGTVIKNSNWPENHVHAVPMCVK